MADLPVTRKLSAKEVDAYNYGGMRRRVPTYRFKPGTTVTSRGGDVAGLREVWPRWEV